MPSFWFALLLVEAFSLHLSLLPVSGYGDGLLRASEEPDPARDHLGIYLAPLIIRTLRVEPDRDARRPTSSPRRGRAGFRESRVDRQARAAERADRDDHDPRDQHRLPDQRHRRDRERVRDPRPRLAARLLDPDARLPDDLGADADLRRARDPRQPVADLSYALVDPRIRL